MNIKTYQHPKAFLAVAQAFFEQDEAANSLINGVAQRLVKAGEEELQDVFMSVVYDQDSPVLAASMQPPHPLLLSYFPDAPREALQCVAGVLKERDAEIPRVLGPDALSSAFSEIWCAGTDRTYQESVRMRFYCLNAITPLTPPQGAVRVATDSDHPLVVEWLLAMHEEIFAHNDMTQKEAEKNADTKITAGDAYYWEVDGQPVSTAHRTRPTEKSWCINAVYTPPEFRNKGYATACVAAVAQNILDTGKEYACLFADQSNPVSNSIYQKIGFKAYCDFVEYTFN